MEPKEGACCQHAEKVFMKGEAYIQDSLTLRLIKYHCYMVSDFAFTGDPKIQLWWGAFISLHGV